MYRDVGAFVDGSADAEGVVEVAVNACALTGAHLNVIGAPRDPGHVMHLAQASGAVLAKAVADSQGAANAMAARIEHAASERGVSCLHHTIDRKSTRLNSSHIPLSRMPSSA